MNDKAPIRESADWIPARRFKQKGLSRFLWRSLDMIAPQLAERYLEHLVRSRVLHMRQSPASGNLPIALIGGLELSLGVARTAQILRAGIEAADIPLHPMDCSPVLRFAHERPPRPPAPASGTMIFCVNPPEMTRLLGYFGPRICAGKRLIGYWWWELDRMPRAWRRWAKLMDEIWVGSRFVQETFQRALPGKTVRLVPLPVPEPRPSKAGRGDFGLAEDRFTVLTALDLSSGWHRKNPLGSIKAFRHAFPDPGRAQLLLKVSGADQNPDQLARLRREIGGLPNVHILDRTLPLEDLAALVRCCDVLLSLHRSEGLGLFIAEAMWLGTPVVATAYSGVMDMLDEDNAMLVRYQLVPVDPNDYPSVEPDARWAEPDLDHAADCLRRLADSPALRTELREKARQRAERQFSLDRFRELAPSLLTPHL